MEKRMRIFAGPNGSGKSTAISMLQSKFNCGYYVNPDLLLADVKKNGCLNLADYGLCLTNDELEKHISENAQLMQKSKSLDDSMSIKIESNIIMVNNPTDYEASLISSFIRDKMLASGISFTTESVFSHPSKIELIKEAKKAGYKTFFYFVCLESPEINIQRVASRVINGGHNVPKEKIVDRYYRTLGLAYDVAKLVDRAFFIDNTKSHTLLAIMENGAIIQQNENFKAKWFEEYIGNKLN